VLADGRRLRSVSAAAGRARVRAGMTVAEARAMCADLEVLDWDEVAILHAITEMSAALLAGSPQVTPVAGAPGLWWVGASGFDGIGGERALLYDLVRIARRWHPRPRVAIADSCVAARAATWANHDASPGSTPTDRRSSIFIVPPAGCAAYLAAAPLALVPMDDELRATLGALGLHTAGAFAALSAEDVERRWGDMGLTAWQLARGEDQRRPVLLRPEVRRMVSVELAAPAETMEPVLFLVRAALDRLVTELVAEGRAAAAIAITLTLDVATSALPTGGAPHTVTREVRPARPLGRTAPLFERCRALLDGWAPGAPVCGVAVSIVATAPLSGEQGDLLAQGWRDPAAVDAALARLRAELGPNVVVPPAARATGADRGRMGRSRRGRTLVARTPYLHRPRGRPRAAVRRLVEGRLPPGLLAIRSGGERAARVPGKWCGGGVVHPRLVRLRAPPHWPLPQRVILTLTIRSCS
jgi:protein ImuB